MVVASAGDSGAFCGRDAGQDGDGGDQDGGVEVLTEQQDGLGDGQ